MADRRARVSGAVAPGMLLVATADLLDPNFSGTVVLLLDADDDGTLGVVINRPSPVAVDDVLEPWGHLVDEPERLFVGGPVGPEAALAVGRLRGGGDVPPGFRPVAGSLGLVDLDAPTELISGALSGLRIFAGYAGWGAGQLADEIREGSWHVVAGEPGDAFVEDPTRLHRDVLRRQGGELAWESTRPLDPDLN